MNHDCLRLIFLYLSPTDLLSVERVSLDWKIAARSTWSSFRKLNMRDICNEQKPKRILRRANNYVRILNLQGCKYNEDELEKISGYFPNLNKIIFNDNQIVTEHSLLKVLKNYKNMYDLIKRNNIINIMRWGSKLRLKFLVNTAAIKFKRLERKKLISDKEIFNLIKHELDHSERIFLTTYYYWAFHDETLNIAYDELIKKGFYNK